MLVRKELGKILLVLGTVLLAALVAPDLVYLVILFSVIVFFWLVYREFKDYQHDVIFLLIMVLYFSAIIFVTVVLSLIESLSGTLKGVTGGILILAGIYLSGILESLKKSF